MARLENFGVRPKVVDIKPYPIYYEGVLSIIFPLVKSGGYPVNFTSEGDYILKVLQHEENIRICNEQDIRTGCRDFCN